MWQGGWGERVTCSPLTFTPGLHPDLICDQEISCVQQYSLIIVPPHFLHIHVGFRLGTPEVGVVEWTCQCGFSWLNARQVTSALDCGYRVIDTAQKYGVSEDSYGKWPKLRCKEFLNSFPARCGAQWTVFIHIQGNEKGIGKGLSAAFAEGRVKRDEVFVTTKAGKRGCTSATFDSLHSLLLRSARFQICNTLISEVAKAFLSFVLLIVQSCVITMFDHPNLLKARRCGLRTMVIRRPLILSRTHWYRNMLQAILNYDFSETLGIENRCWARMAVLIWPWLSKKNHGPQAFFFSHVCFLFESFVLESRSLRKSWAWSRSIWFCPTGLELAPTSSWHDKMRFWEDRRGKPWKIYNENLERKLRHAASSFSGDASFLDCVKRWHLVAFRMVWWSRLGCPITMNATWGSSWTMQRSGQWQASSKSIPSIRGRSWWRCVRQVMSWETGSTRHDRHDLGSLSHT